MKKIFVCFAMIAMIFLVACGDDSSLYESKEDFGDTGSGSLGKICTGQNKCYNDDLYNYEEEEITCPNSQDADFFGQDAYYASLGKCTPHSFTVQTLSNQNVVYDNNTSLMWQQTIPRKYYTWDDALSYCDGLTYAGYSDWRLPTPQELLTIVDNSRSDPAIDTTFFPDTPNNWFWSSSTYVDNTSYAWGVTFGIGYVASNDKHHHIYVRCVRGTTSPATSFNSSTVNGDVILNVKIVRAALHTDSGAVGATDTKTGLVWQKSYVEDKSWQDALSYCENLAYAGYSDWRLPNKNELASLVNYEKYDPASKFPDMPSEYFWSSSTYVDGRDIAWGVGFHIGDVYGKNKSSKSLVRCVRTGN